MDWKTPDKIEPWRIVIYTGENNRITCDRILQVATSDGELGVVFMDDLNDLPHSLYFAAGRWVSVEIYLPIAA